MKKAIYALSADPLTNGHLNVIERILNIFDHVVVAIGINPDKKYAFTLDEREALTKRVLEKYGDRVSIKAFPGLLSDFAYESDVKTIVRGARSAADFDFERLINDINQSFRQGLETIIYFADQRLSHVSSSAAKELVRNQAKNVLEYVPLIVKRALERRIRGQYLIGITGGIASGKSYVGKALCDYNNYEVRGEGIPAYTPSDLVPKYYNIDLDEIGHEVLEKAPEKIYLNTRLALAGIFGKEILDENGFVKIQVLRQLIFKDQQCLALFNNQMKEPMSLLLRRKLLNIKGVIFINSALIADAGISDIVNNDIIFVTASEESRQKRLIARGYSEIDIAQRLASQLEDYKKIELLNYAATEQGHGSLITYQNDRVNCLEDIKTLYMQIRERIVNNDFR
jgi:pantetheine-phosphate adenylyltransferase